ncbi:major capsid protein [Mycobacterium phage Weirdo19]|uniref:Major capsid protein n=1 Tax=Mycobacterium phage Weirdo19 TaxID=2601610 RepID=A0A6M2YSQ8_9CAUD|nr:major head protein [Mycobacterium phage Weirdo19]QEA10774.1 major capsid protein [Mycobacterium phage Weirdo19]
MTRSGVVSISDGPRTTVADLIGNPMWVPTKQKELMTGIFISEDLLRNEGSNPSGLVGYHEGDPAFLVGDVEDVAEFAEIPVTYGEMGIPRVAVANKQGLGIRISREMRDENRIGAVNKQMTQLRNTFRRADDRAVRALLLSNAVPSLAVEHAWDTANGNPRLDIGLGIKEITFATPTGDIADDEEWMGFEPDTIVMNPGLLPVLLDNEKFLKVYNGNIAADNPLLNWQLPGMIAGKTIIGSLSFPEDRILICERGTIGFYSDTRPLEFTGVYPEGNGPNGGPTETWRSDTTHKRAMALDQPKAALWLTGLVTP